MFTAIAVALSSLAAGDDKPGGWPELFPELQNFGRKIEAPTPAKPDNDPKSKRYSQSATYDWMGGRFEVITIKIARDGDFKERYAAETVKKLKPAPKELEINKKRAYLWDLEMPDKLDKVNRWLVVVLADDKVIIVEQKGFGLELEDVAKKLDFDKVAKALDNPPPKPK